MRFKGEPKDFLPGDLLKIVHRDSIDYFFIEKVEWRHVLIRFILTTGKNGTFFGLHSTQDRLLKTTLRSDVQISVEIIRAG